MPPGPRPASTATPASPPASRPSAKGDLDVLVVDAQQLEWQRQADEQLKAVVTGAIQLVAVRERAAAAGISRGALAALLAPVPVDQRRARPGGGPQPRTTRPPSCIMTVVLFLSISVFGSMVLTGVVEEKASRVVEVLLARIPARILLAGKIAGIGLLGLARSA